jgi:hypothetical protein
MTNSHSQFPASQLRIPVRTIVSPPHGIPARGLYQPLSQHSTTDLPSTLQRPRSAAPSRNVSSASLSAMAKASRDRERDLWMPDYLEASAYGVAVAAFRTHLASNVPTAPAPYPLNGAVPPGGISMRREHSATIPASRNHSPHHPAPLLSHRGLAFEVAERSASSPNEPPQLPSRFNDRDRCAALELLNDGMDAKFAGPSKGADSDAATVRADHPIPPSTGIYYYETTIISRGSQGFFLSSLF